MDVNICVVLGLLGSIVLALGLIGLIGHVFGDTMNTFSPGTGNTVKGAANIFIALAIITVIIATILFVLCARGSTSNIN